MGIVYKAEQIVLNRIVALKMIPSDREIPEAARKRFQREAEAVARLRHPNIVQIYDIGTANGVPFLSLEFIEGGTLAGRLANGPLPPREATVLIETLARAMAYAHQQGIIHRDLKPANVLLTTDGQPKVADFGLAKFLNASVLTQTNAILGTPSYMPPEQAVGRKDIGPAADVYALGAILYHCLTGRPPFRGATVVQTLEQVQTFEPLPPSKLYFRRLGMARLQRFGS
jgi:serine/threonine protein kinase